MAKELSDFHSQIVCLKSANDELNAKIVKLNECPASTSIVENLSICTRCKEFNVDAYHANIAIIVVLNEDISKLNAKLKFAMMN